MSQRVKSWNQNLNPDDLVPEPPSLHSERQQAGMEILILLLKLSSLGFFGQGNMPKKREKESSTHSNLGGSPDDVVIFIMIK